MPAIATTSSLNDYPRLSISSYLEQLRITQPDSLPVSYKHKGKHHSYNIELAKTSCNYGNYRYWFLCPSCSKRTGVLYCAGSYVCRHCIGASYHSQLQQPVDRIYTKLNALRERLGWQVGVIHGIGERPKGMHHSTYERLLVEYEQLINKLIRTFY
ncbi:hypothetical protein [Psychrobacter maritimus]|uniref:hypothetical protein n=1 Tax=Psychrobacter maritimus TaxID=256325 RepID=UPI00191A8B86|nr:hypothetical protein [Psychrobacter maritimus]